MKAGLKTGWYILFICICFTGKGQVEKGLIPFSNQLLMNPSFAGIEKNTNIWSSLQFSSQPENILNHTFSLTCDTWSEKMKGGIAYYFYQGLNGEVNTNTTGAGITFSKPFKSGRNGQFIPSLNLNAYTATKQWFVHFIDGILDKQVEPPSPPGKEFFRNNLFLPRAGFLWSSPATDIGLSASYSFHKNLGLEEEMQVQSPYHIIFHIARKMRGQRKGLVSQPYKASPELVVLYSENLMLSRTGLRMERIDHLFGVYLQNNYSDNIHGIGGIFGWKSQNFRLNLAAGAAWSFPFRKTAIFGEASLGLILPYTHINEKIPWAPPKKSF